MVTKTIKTVKLHDGTVIVQAIVYLKDTDEHFAYTIANPRSKQPYYMMDGSRIDLTDREIKKLREAMAAVESQDEEAQKHERGKRERVRKKV